MKRNVIGPAFEDQTPQEFYERIKGLYKAPEAKPEDGPVKGIKVSVNKRGALLVRSTREQKAMTEDEVLKLAQDCGLEVLKLTEELTKRGFAIANPEGLITNAKPKRQRTGRKPKQDQADDHIGDGRLEASRTNQFFISGPDSDVSSQSDVCAEDGLEKK